MLFAYFVGTVSKSELIRRCTDLLILAIALAAGNFIWQAMTHKNWDVAIERTYFQTIALLAALSLP